MDEVVSRSDCSQYMSLFLSMVKSLNDLGVNPDNSAEQTNMYFSTYMQYQSHKMCVSDCQEVVDGHQ